MEQKLIFNEMVPWYIWMEAGTSVCLPHFYDKETVTVYNRRVWTVTPKTEHALFFERTLANPLFIAYYKERVIFYKEEKHV